MQSFPRTVILRHRKENLKKCSLRGLEGREDLLFCSYPFKMLPDLTGYAGLALNAPPLSADDADRGLLIIDGTWRLAAKMKKAVDEAAGITYRSLPGGWKTAYPRRQPDCPDPDEGLASVEALFAAYTILGRDTDGLLDLYRWRDEFLDF